MPEIPCRLFIPQAYLHSMGIGLDAPDSCYVTLYHDRAEFKVPTGQLITIPYYPITHLPVQ